MGNGATVSMGTRPVPPPHAQHIVRAVNVGVSKMPAETPQIATVVYDAQPCVRARSIKIYI